MDPKTVFITDHAIQRYALRKYNDVTYHLGRRAQLEQELRADLEKAWKTDMDPKTFFRHKLPTRNVMGRCTSRFQYGRKGIHSRKAYMAEEVWENESWRFFLGPVGVVTVSRKGKGSRH